MSAFPEQRSAIDPAAVLPPKAARPEAEEPIHSVPNPDRVRARRLREEAAALLEGPHLAASSDGSGVLMALDECVATLMAHETQRIERALRRDRILTGCVRDLDSPGEGARASSTAAALRGLADRMDELDEKEARGSSAALLIRRLSAPLVAMVLAGGAVFAGARLIPEPAWKLPGLAVFGLGLITLALGRTLGLSAERGVSADRDRLDSRAQEILARARIVITDSSRLDAHALREYAEQVARRDLFSSLRTRLGRLLLADEDRESLRDLRAVLADGLTPARQDEFVGRRAQQPALAMPGLAAAVGDAFAKTASVARRRGAAEGVRRGLSEALIREATYLEERADRTDREREAEALWRRLTPVEERPAVDERVDLEGESPSAPRSVSLRSTCRHPLERVPTPTAPTSMGAAPASVAASEVRSLRRTAMTGLRRPPSRRLQWIGCLPYVPPPAPPIVPVPAPSPVAPVLTLPALVSIELPDESASRLDAGFLKGIESQIRCTLRATDLPSPARDSTTVVSTEHPVIPRLDASVLPPKTRSATRIANLSVWPPAEALRDVARRAGTQVESIQRAVHSAVASN